MRAAALHGGRPATAPASSRPPAAACPARPATPGRAPAVRRSKGLVAVPHPVRACPMHDGSESGAGDAADAGHTAAAATAAAAAAAAASPRATLAGASDPEAASALDDRISSGEFTDAGSTKERISRPVRKFFALDPVGPGRSIALWLATLGQRWRAEAADRMPTATGDIREIVGQPVFVPLYRLFVVYGKIFRLAFGPKSFVVVSDPDLAKQVLLTDAAKYSKGLLSEILDFVMGTGLIPADGDVWKARRRAIVPALHRKYIASMLGMFGDCALHGAAALAAQADRAAAGTDGAALRSGGPPPRGAVEMENFFSRLTLDIIGKAVFNYDFDSLTNDDPFIQAVYTALREAEYRSTAFVPYWNFPPLRWLVPRQRKCTDALAIINATLDGLIDRCKAMVEAEDAEFGEEYLADEDPSILRFLIASGEQISSKQLRDDLMTMLIAGHETTAAVLTWTLYCLVNHPADLAAVQAEVDAVLGDAAPTLESVGDLRLTARAIHESMRLYPQPPVLIRRALEDTSLGGYAVAAGSDIFISVWNLHRSPAHWADPDVFDLTRFGPLDGTTPSEVTTGFSYLPFGGGRRKCVGDQFALLEAVTGLAVLLRRFDFEAVDGGGDGDRAPEVSMTTGATIHTKEGLWLVPKRRVHGGGSGAAAAAAAAAEVREEEPAVATASI